MKKISAFLLAAAAALTLAAIPASAEPNAAEVKFYMRDSESWASHESEALEINGDGTFTMTIKSTGVMNINTLFIKDEETSLSDEWANAKLTVDYIRVNDIVELKLKQTEYPIINQNLFDVPFVNVWAETMVENVEKGDQYVNILDINGKPVKIEKVDIKFSISGLGTEAVTQATTTEATTEATTTAATTKATTAATTEYTTSVVELASEKGGSAPLIIGIVVAVLVVAAGVVFFIIRKKNQFY